MTISPYTTYTGIADVKPFERNFDLELKVLQHQQSTYDTTYNNIQAAQKQGLSINFINKDANKQIGDINKRIGEKFAGLDGDYGDLADSKIASKYIDVFKELNNSPLISMYKKEGVFRKNHEAITKMKASKDPKKAGYHTKNEMVYRMELNDYANASMSDAGEVQVSSYVPYVDDLAMQQEAILKIPPTETTKEVTDSQGRKTIVTTKGVDLNAANKIGKAIAMENSPQYDVEAKYAYAQLKGNPERMGAILNSYNQQNAAQKATLVNEQNILLKEYSGKEKDQDFYDTNQALQDEIVKLAPKTIDDLDKNTSLSIIRRDLMSNAVQSSVQAYAPQSSSVTTELDPIYKFSKEYSLKIAQYNSEQSHKAATLELSQDKHALNVAKFKLDAAESGMTVDANGKVVTGTSSTGLATTPTKINVDYASPEQLKKAAETELARGEEYIVSNVDFAKGATLEITGTVLHKKRQAEIDILQNEYDAYYDPNSFRSSDYRKKLSAIQGKLEKLKSIPDTLNKTQILEAALEDGENAFAEDRNISMNPYVIAAKEVMRSSIGDEAPKSIEELEKRMNDEYLAKDDKGNYINTNSYTYKRVQEIKSFESYHQTSDQFLKNADMSSLKGWNDLVNSHITSGKFRFNLEQGKVYSVSGTDKRSKGDRKKFHQDITAFVPGGSQIPMDAITSATVIGGSSWTFGIDGSKLKEDITINGMTITGGTSANIQNLNVKLPPESLLNQGYAGIARGNNGNKVKFGGLFYSIKDPNPRSNFPEYQIIITDDQGNRKSSFTANSNVTSAEVRKQAEGSINRINKQ